MNGYERRVHDAIIQAGFTREFSRGRKPREGWEQRVHCCWYGDEKRVLCRDAETALTLRKLMPDFGITCRLDVFKPTEIVVIAVSEISPYDGLLRDATGRMGAKRKKFSKR